MNTRNLKIGILAMSSINMTGMIVSPAIANIARAFPDASLSSIQMLFTLPALTAVVTSLLSGYLAVLLSQKHLGIAGALLICISGTSVAFMGSVPPMLVLSAIRGCGMGLLAPLAASLSDRYFQGDERDRMMGLSSAVSSGIGMLVALLAGIVAVYSWRYAFLLFLIPLLSMFIGAKLLPAEAPLQKAKGANSVKLSFSPRIVWVALSCFLYLALFHVFGTTIAVYIEEAKIGTSSLAGWSNAIFLCGGMVGGLLFARIEAVTRRFTITVAHLLCGASLLVIIAGRVDLLLLGSFAGGLGMTLMMVKSNLNAIDTSGSAASVPLAVAIVSVSFSLAQFVSPLLTHALSTGLADGSSYAKYQISGILLLGIALVNVAVVFLRRSSSKVA